MVDLLDVLEKYPEQKLWYKHASTCLIPKVPKLLVCPRMKNRKKDYGRILL